MRIPKYKYRIVQNQGTCTYYLQYKTRFFYWWLGELVVLIPVMISSLITLLAFPFFHLKDIKGFTPYILVFIIPFLIITGVQILIHITDFRWHDIAETDKDPTELDKPYQEHRKEMMRKHLSNTYRTIVKLK